MLYAARRVRHQGNAVERRECVLDNRQLPSQIPMLSGMYGQPDNCSPRPGKQLFDATMPFAEESPARSWWSVGSTLAILLALLVCAAVAPWWPLRMALDHQRAGDGAAGTNVHSRNRRDICNKLVAYAYHRPTAGDLAA